jgi:hypothetical protein
MSKRLRLLRRIHANQLIVLISKRLAEEYRQQVRVPKNEFVRAFFELLTPPDGVRVIPNWRTPWSGGDRDTARRCRFPAHDEHVLRTAIRGYRTTIYTEDGRMLSTDACIYRNFRVHVTHP